MCAIGKHPVLFRHVAPKKRVHHSQLFCRAQQKDPDTISGECTVVLGEQQPERRELYASSASRFWAPVDSLGWDLSKVGTELELSLGDLVPYVD